ncbi:Uncharacterized protein JA1_004704 [Spathaspora sp. JA1]|nr:Uncharacterized protein JA1_004704 [Spathaspora sp. JA1]
MYQQPNHSYTSADSLRRLSSNNPFRNQIDREQLQSQAQASGSHVFNISPTKSPSKISRLGQSSITFENWIEKNKSLLDLSSDEEEDDIKINKEDDILNVYQSNGGTPLSSHNNSASGTPRPPQFPPRATRAGSDTSIHYSNRNMQSNNPFASALNEPDSYVHRREPPAPPRRGSASKTPPARPPKPKTESVPPPSYEEAAGPKAAKREYRREKSSNSSSNDSSQSSKPHRSHSDSNGHGHDRSRSHRSHHHHSRKDNKQPSQHPSTRTVKPSSSLSRNKSPSKRTTEQTKAKNLDTIDKLDVTAFFGGGFHHDGPFDACTPHRNKNVKAAPVMAFPADGPNNYIGGAGGNIDKNEQMDLAFGTYNEGYERKDAYKPSGTATRTRGMSDGDSISAGIKTNRVHNDPSSTIYTAKQNPSVVNFDSNLKAQPIHGSTTAGLGSTTFVDGAPAPKTAAQEAEQQSGLSRKKSLVQRLRKKFCASTNEKAGSRIKNGDFETWDKLKV